MVVFLLRRLARWFGIGIPADGTPEDLMRRRVVSMAWPAVIDGLLVTLVHVIDTFLVSMVSDEALAGVGTATQVVFILIVVLTAISVGCSVLVAQAIGAKNNARASMLTKQSLTAGTLLAIPLVAFGYTFASPLINLFGVEPEVAAIAVEFLQVMAFAMIIFVNSFALAGIFRGMGDTRTPMLANLVGNVLNAVVAYGLIFGKLGMPELGVVGSAWGAVASRVVVVVMLMGVLLFRDTAVSLAGIRGWFPRMQTIIDVCRIGVPSAVEQFLTSLGFATMTGVAAMLGTSALAAHRITFNALSLSFMPAMGMAIAASAIVGQSTGAKDPASARRAAKISATYAAIWMSMIGVLYFAFAPWIIKAFSTDPEVVSQGANALRVLAVSQPFWSWMMVYSGSMRGIGNARFPMVVNSINLWAAVILGLVLIRWLDLSLAWIWSAFLVFSPITVIVLRRRLLSDPLMADPDESPDDRNRMSGLPAVAEPEPAD